MLTINDYDSQSRPFEHIPIGADVCFAIDTIIFTDSGCITKGDYGIRVESQYPGIHIIFNDIKNKKILIRRRQLHYPVLKK